MGKEVSLLKKNRLKNKMELNTQPVDSTQEIERRVPEKLQGMSNFYFPDARDDLMGDMELLDYRLRQTIINMVAFGVPLADIATLMRMSPEQVKTQYGHELTTGARQLEVNLENKVVDLALHSPDPRVSHKASMDLLRHKFGWKEASPRGNPSVSIRAESVVFHLPEQVSAEAWQAQADKFRGSLIDSHLPEEAMKEGVDKPNK
jgi:hypothetical protein